MNPVRFRLTLHRRAAGDLNRATAGSSSAQILNNDPVTLNVVELEWAVAVAFAAATSGASTVPERIDRGSVKCFAALKTCEFGRLRISERAASRQPTAPARPCLSGI